MDECALIFLAVAAAGTILAGSIAGIVALVKISRLQKDVASLAFRLESLKRRAESGVDVAPAPVAAPQTLDTPPMAPVAASASTAEPVARIPTAVPSPVETRRRIEEAIPPTAATSAWSWDDLEARIGKRWMTWAGAIVLFLSAAFFVKYAFDNNWLGPAARVALGVAFGIAMLLAGERSIRRDMGALGQGLVGAGLAVVFVSLFAGYSLYHLMSNIAAFAAMAIVVGAGMAL
ncbi:MAG: DUF2339 domain-containing protein, partial [Deltaproteobacteria bacterium]|nr:DUF2339 domain-containing protein [Deltaproteobacteria bacterium]